MVQKWDTKIKTGMAKKPYFMRVSEGFIPNPIFIY